MISQSECSRTPLLWQRRLVNVEDVNKGEEYTTKDADIYASKLIAINIPYTSGNSLA